MGKIKNLLIPIEIILLGKEIPLIFLAEGISHPTSLSVHWYHETLNPSSVRAPKSAFPSLYIPVFGSEPQINAIDFIEISTIGESFVV